MLENGNKLLQRMSKWAGDVAGQLPPGTTKTQLEQAKTRTTDLSTRVTQWLSDTAAVNSDPNTTLEQRKDLIAQGHALFRDIGTCFDSNARLFDGLL